MNQDLINLILWKYYSMQTVLLEVNYFYGFYLNCAVALGFIILGIYLGVTLEKEPRRNSV